MAELIVVSETEIEKILNRHPCIYCLTREAVEASGHPVAECFEMIMLVRLVDGRLMFVKSDDIQQTIKALESAERGEMHPFSYYIAPIETLAP